MGYFDAPFGITDPIDNRRIPDSFNELMVKHDYRFRMVNVTYHNWKCNHLTAKSLNEETKKLIRQVYAKDFDLLCSHFGYCDKEELTCMKHIDGMCGESGGKSQAVGDKAEL